MWSGLFFSKGKNKVKVLILATSLLTRQTRDQQLFNVGSHRSDRTELYSTGSFAHVQTELVQFSHGGVNGYLHGRSRPSS